MVSKISSASTSKPFEHDPMYVRMCNLLMKAGKKSKSQKIVQTVIEKINEGFRGQALNILYMAVVNASSTGSYRYKPYKVKKKKKKAVKKVKYVPYPAESETRGMRAVRLIIKAAQLRRSPLPVWQKLTDEFVDTAGCKGESILSRDMVDAVVVRHHRSVQYRWVYPARPKSIKRVFRKDICKRQTRQY